MKCPLALAIILGIAMHASFLVRYTDGRTTCYSCYDLSGYGCDDKDLDPSKTSSVTCAGSCVYEYGFAAALGIKYSRLGSATNPAGDQETTCSEDYQQCDYSLSAFGISVEACQTCCYGALCNGRFKIDIDPRDQYRRHACYACRYDSAPGLPNLCADAYFDAGSPFVNRHNIDGCGGGQCYVTDSETPGGVRTVDRGCGYRVCNQQVIAPDTTCCNGSLCNARIGGSVGLGGDLGDNQCYGCIDIRGYGCDDDNFDQDQASMVTCPGSCVKMWAMSSTGRNFSIRGCATTDTGDDNMKCSENGCESQTVSGVSTEICKYCCDGELCNGAGSGSVISTAVILSATAASALLVMMF